MSKISDEVQSLSEKIANHFSITKDHKVDTQDHAFVACAPEGITRETLEAVKTYESNYKLASTLAFGMAANKHAAENKSVDEIDAVFPLFGHDTLKLNWQRTKEVPAGIGKDAGTRTVFGHVSRGATDVSIKSGSGQMKAVLSTISENAKALLG